MANIVVAFPKMEDAVNIRDLLVRNGYQVVSVCTCGTNVLSMTDSFEDGIVVCGYRLADMLFSELRMQLPESFTILLLASSARLAEVDTEGVICVAMPLRAANLLNTIEMLTLRMARNRRRKSKRSARRTDEEEKLLSTAKKILMEKHHMDEPEAHRYLQKLSMDSGNDLMETAQMVISIMLN